MPCEVLSRDLSGLLQAVATVPLEHDEPFFKEPWEAQAFAMVPSLHERKLFTWQEKRRRKLQSQGETITLGGVRVSQNDLAVGDDTGIVVVPQAQLMTALEQAERIVEIDEKVEERIRAGASFGEAAAAAGYLPPRK